MSEPRLSRRESSTGLRRDTLASQNRKRSGSNASTSSRPSMFNPKGFGLTRKASTATLSVAPVSASGSAVDHALGTGTEAKRADKVRPVRQATRAEDALRFVQARAPVAPAALAPEESTESPKANPAPLAPIPDDTPGDAPPPSTSPSRIPRPKSRTSLIPIFRGSPERTKALPGNAASPGTADKSSFPTPKRSSTTSPPTSKFRPPAGLTRKPSTSSIRSHKPTSSSPLASLTAATPAPALPKLDTSSVSVQPPSVSDGAKMPSPSSTSWLSSVRGITSSKPAVAQDSPQIVISESPTAQGPEADAAEKKPPSGLGVQTSSSAGLAVSPVLTSKSSTGTLQPSPTQAEYSTAPVSPVDSDNGLVVIDSASSPIQASANGNGYRINELAAQHASNAAWSAINAPASWLAWMTAGSGSGSEGNNSGTGGVEVMDIESDEEEAGKGLDKGKGKEVQRPPHVTALSVDSVVPPLVEGDANADATLPPLAIKPVSQNTLSLNATALRYALQLPLLGRSRLQPVDSQGEISPHSGQSIPGQPNVSQAENRSPGSNGIEHANPGMIVTRYSDDHDFVIIEVEVDGWILIDTEGGLASPSTPMQGPSTTGRHGAGGNFWWDYYIGRTGYGPAAPGKVDDAGPAAEIGDGLSSPARSTEVVRDTDSVNSSLLTNVLRPFGRGKDVKAQPDASTAATAAQNDDRETAQPPKTQAELIKEEALARQPASVVPGLPSPVLNTATKSGWVSYFSSKASRSTPVMSDGRAIKRSAENAGEMEVMDIDEEDLSEPIEIQTSNSVPSTSAVQLRVAATRKPASPLTDSPSVKRKASVISQDKKSSASSSHSAKVSFPNLVLPTFGDTFYTVPRCMPPRAPTAAAGPASAGSWKLKRTVKNFSTMLFNTNTSDKALGPNVGNAEMEEYQRQSAERQRLTNRANFATVEPAVPRSRASRPRPGNTRSTSAFGSLAIDDFGQDLPRVFSVLGNENALGDIGGPIRAAVIGVHGWFPGPLVRSVFGEPTGTSIKFATMGVDALRQFAEKHGLNLESVTAMPLEGEGTIERRVTKADVVLVATHSQGSIVSTHLIARLISDGHIRTKSNREAVNNVTQNTGVVPPIAPHRVCCLAMCGIHMGPLYSLNSSSLAQPYLQWFESQAARELFEFQNTESEVSRSYVAALSTALDHGIKFVYVASLNDQVVPIYSGTFVAASHPLILRGLFLDGDAYSSSDFLSNLLVLLLRVKNAGLDEHGLVVHLSEATAGSLSGIGHSTAYEDTGPYTLAVRYMFETSDLSPDTDFKLSVDAFEARASRNDYEIPWLLHSVISDTRIGRIFSAELAQLRESFGEWKPTTAVLRDIQRKLAPIRMSPLRHSMIAPPQDPATSKL